MGQFTISLPHHITGEVRCGKVIKIQKHLLGLFVPWKKFNTSEKTGYIVKISTAVENVTEFRFYKTKEGNWYYDADGTLPIAGDIALSIRQAIEKYEHSLA